MDEQFEKAVERELAGCKPLPVPYALQERLRGSLDERLTWQDRVVAALVGCGGIAACVVAGIVALQALSGPPKVELRREELAAQRQVQADMMTAIAMR